jgi:glycosyltransferase involved in cell wall biosynthesis
MHIAYIVAFNGPRLLKERYNINGHNLGATQKVMSIANSLLIQGHEIDILSPAIAFQHTGKWYSSFREKLNFKEGYVQVSYCPSLDHLGLNRLFAMKYLSQLLYQKHSQKSFDCALIYNISEVTFYTSLIAKKLGIVNILEYEDDTLVSRKGNKRKRSYYWYKQILKQTNKVIAGALLVCPELSTQLDTQNIAIIPGIIDEPLHKATYRTPPALNNKPVRIIYTGGLEYDKGPDILIASLSYIKIPIDLHIYGTGNLELKLKSMCLNLPKFHKITIHGLVTRDILINSLINAHILVNPHRINLGDGLKGRIFPFKLIEYISTGVPIVSSDLSTFKSNIKDAITFYYDDTPISLAKALEYVIKNHKICRNVAINVKNSIKKKYNLYTVGQTISMVLEKAYQTRMK